MSVNSPTEGHDPRTATMVTAEECWDHFENQETGLCEVLSRSRESALQASLWWSEVMQGEGRIIGLGAGTSGRLIQLEMAEWGPTFSVPEERRLALIAGGDEALKRAVEGAEDDGPAGQLAVRESAVGNEDLVLGISASGAAAYVREGLLEAARRGARTLLITSNPETDWFAEVRSLRLLLETGSETVAGSTRLGAATATHRLLHRISTIGALRLGWIYRGRMIRMQITNAKLRRRARTMVSELTKLSEATSTELISKSGNDLRLAVAIGWLGSSTEIAQEVLNAANGRLSAIERHLKAIQAGELRPEELAGLLRKP
ncbi:hypothetical protein CBD41_04435 [bacterium TMED181]|nr:N-acetylmuramic acid 6-phosphate etherase [Planctomycetota bacterium]OUW45061.1 MAG: hypothetical protein CBD41_04435 [bacterium TMED181]